MTPEERRLLRLNIRWLREVYKRMELIEMAIRKIGANDPNAFTEFAETTQSITPDKRRDDETLPGGTEAVKS